MESMIRRSSVITFDQTSTNPPTNWQQQSIIDNRKASSGSIHSNTSSNSSKNNSEQPNFSYQQPQLIRYPTVQISLLYPNISSAFFCRTFNRTLVILN
jgi:hypothetical protein